ncbi:TLDc domain-containing protein [Entamoeba marina]
MGNIESSTTSLKKSIEENEVQANARVMENWCGMKYDNIIFDSDRNNSTKQSILSQILNKNYLYFIHFDENGNIFGGYLSEQVHTTDVWIYDDNAFLFTLTRNYLTNRNKFNIEKGKEVFWIYSSSQWLYRFGIDLYIFKPGIPRSATYQNKFNYNGIEKAITDKQGPCQTFSIERIVIVKMKDVKEK